VFSPNRSLILLACLVWLPIAGCANGPSGQAIQDALKADPKLKDTPPFGTVANPSPTPSGQLSTDFPPELPLYPQGKLIAVTGAIEGDVLTKWSVGDSRDRVLSFYRQAFQSNGWQDFKQSTENGQDQFSARHQNGLQAVFTLEPADPANQGSNFVLQFGRGGITIQATPSAASSPTGPQPGDKDFIGPVPLATTASGNPQSTPSNPPQSFTDLDKTPKQLLPYVTDLNKLGVLTLLPTQVKGGASKSAKEFEPNRVITRREYVRWLLAANNRIYLNRSAKQIRLGTEAAQPAFQDVAKSDPDFPAIQGLAEAGLLPSPLAGDSTTVRFRPDAPLTREDLVLWKVPVDMRQALPIATIDAVKQTWGFQDSARIDARALKAVLADFQNGDQANIRRVFGYTTLFQPKRSVTRAEAAAALWYFGYQGDGLTAEDALKEKPVSEPVAPASPSPIAPAGR
jgi:S-layer homology domain